MASGRRERGTTRFTAGRTAPHGTTATGPTDIPATPASAPYLATISHSASGLIFVVSTSTAMNLSLIVSASAGNLIL